MADMGAQVATQANGTKGEKKVVCVGGGGGGGGGDVHPLKFWT